MTNEEIIKKLKVQERAIKEAKDYIVQLEYKISNLQKETDRKLIHLRNETHGAFVKLRNDLSGRNR